MVTENACFHFRKIAKFRIFCRNFVFAIIFRTLQFTRKSSNSFCFRENNSNYIKNRKFLSCHAHLLLSYSYFCETFRPIKYFRVRFSKNTILRKSPKTSCHPNILTKMVPLFYTLLKNFCLFIMNRKINNFAKILAILYFLQAIFTKIISFHPKYVVL